MYKHAKILLNNIQITEKVIRIVYIIVERFSVFKLKKVLYASNKNSLDVLSISRKHRLKRKMF